MQERDKKEIRAATVVIHFLHSNVPLATLLGTWLQELMAEVESYRYTIYSNCTTVSDR